MIGQWLRWRLRRVRWQMTRQLLVAAEADDGDTEMVEEFEWRRAGAAFRAIDHDEVRIDFRLQHRLANRQKFPRMTDA